MPKNLNGKCLIVTGAATGIGHATARSLLGAGARVALWDVDGSAIKDLAAEAGAQGQEAVAVTADVACADAVADAFQQTLDKLGALHGAFNNAGIGAPSVPVEDIREADFDRIVGINLKGVWLCMQQQIKHMKAHGGGSIVNTASVAGLVGFQGQAAYTATKHGVVGLSKAAAVECAPAGIRINAICPGAVQTPILRHLEAAGMTKEMLEAASPIKRIADPAEIGDAVAWLLSEQSSFVTGAAIPVDGGWTAQ